MLLRKMMEKLLWFLIKTVFFIITFFLTWCVHIQNNDISPATFQNYVWHPNNKKLYSLDCCYCSMVYKKVLFQIDDFCFLFHRKNIISCTFTTSNSYLANSLAAVLSELDLYRLLTFHVPYLMFLLHFLGCTRGSAQAWGTCMCYVTVPVFRVRSY